MLPRPAAIGLLALAALGGCFSSGTKDGDDRPLIVATTGPVGDLVENLVGDNARVVTLMGPGVDPHLYKELPQHTELLGRADLIFYNGLHLEGGMGDTLDRLGKRKPVFAVTHKLEESSDPRLITPEGFAGHSDPHVWHDVALWAECAGYVADCLVEVLPEHAESIQASSMAYQAELKTLDEECRERLASIPEEHRFLVTAHDAFAYFSKAYGLEAVGLKGISTEDEIDLNHMQEVIDLVVEKKIPCVFVESAVAPRIMQALAEPCHQAGHDVLVPSEKHELYADALGKPGSGADNYVGMIRANVNTIVAGLRGELPKD